MDGARQATIEDLPEIAELARLAIVELGEIRGGRVWQRREARQEPVHDDLADAVVHQGDHLAVVVGTIHDTVVGYGVSRIEQLSDGDRLSVVTDLYVDPGARGVGVGEAMMDRLVAHAEAAGAIGIDAMALPGDRATKNFFETFGLKARAIVVHRPLGEAARPTVCIVREDPEVVEVEVVDP